MSRLRFEKTLAAAIRAQLACFDDCFPPERAAVHTEMAKRGREVTRRLLLTKQADNAAKSPRGLARAQLPWQQAQAIFDELISSAVCCSVDELQVDGSDMISIGFRDRSIGLVLNKLLGEVAAEQLPNERPVLLARAQRLFRSGFGTRSD